MFSPWELVRPTLWHPMSMLEQSMMDLDVMASEMARSRFPMTQSLLAAPSTREDDEFFRDLPVLEHGQTPAQTQQQPAQTQQGKQGKGSTTVSASMGKEAGERDTRAFSSYSFSNSSVVDDQGRRIASTRRRYEDSTGRLKAVHEREVDKKRLKTIWNRASRDDKGEHHTLCAQCTSEEFEKLWRDTPFGQAEAKKHHELEAQKGGGEGAEGVTQKLTGVSESSSSTATESASTGADSSKLCAKNPSQQQCAANCNCEDCQAKQACPPNCDCSVCRSTKYQARKVERELRNVVP